MQRPQHTLQRQAFVWQARGTVMHMPWCKAGLADLVETLHSDMSRDACPSLLHVGIAGKMAAAIQH